jgi:hypothetical protein
VSSVPTQARIFAMKSRRLIAAAKARTEDRLGQTGSEFEDVRFGSTADVAERRRDICYSPESGQTIGDTISADIA